MKKDYVLLVSGFDYGVLNYRNYCEENKMTNREWIKKMKNEGLTYFEFEDEDNDFTVRLYEFEPNTAIHKGVEDIIRDAIQDYDDSKHRNFFVARDFDVEEEV